MLKKVSKILIYILIFLFPLFFIPGSLTPLSYQKEIFFLIFVSLSLFFWFLDGIFLKKKISFKENFFLYLALFFLIFFSALSTLLSTWKNASFWGFHLEIGESFLFLIFSVLFFFLILNIFEKSSEIFVAFLIFFFSSLILSLLSIFQAYNLFTLPFINLAISLSSLSIFVAISLPIFLAFYFQSKGFLKFLFFLPILLSIFVLILSGVKTAWLLVFIETIFLLIFALEKKKGEIDFERGILLSVFLILSIFFYFFPIRFKIFPPLPLEVSLDFLAEIPILKGVFSQGLKNILLGTGPGTFVFAFSKFKPLALNQTLFWGTRFSFGASTFFDFLVTKGILTTISLLFLFFISLYFIFRKILKEREKIKIFEIGIFASTFVLIISSFFFAFNLFLWFYFYFFLAITFSLILRSKEIDFTKIPFSRPFFFTIFFIIISFSLILTGWQFEKFLADFYYQKAGQKIADIDLSISLFKKATKLNPNADLYWRDLSQTLLLKANQISQDQNLPIEEKRRLVDQTISDGISALNQAISLSPNNVANWNVRGFFFRNLIGIEKAGDIAIQSYKTATALEPSSPYSFTEMGRVYILMAQDFERKGMQESKISSLNLAKENLERAIQLKSDYAPAHYLLAVVFSQQGKEKEAISKLEEAIKFAPQDLGVAFQLSLLYYRSGQLEKAENLLKTILQNSPQYSNAKYLLGLVYDQKGEKEKSLKEFEEVLALNPDNEEVKKIVENLKKGLPALEGILTPKTLSEQTPSEIKP
jgi:tetratricopeptide (TPR) repeat protein